MLTRTEQRHLQRALAIASTSTERHRHGVILAVGRRVIAVGVNRSRNIPVNCTDPKREAGYHAEVAAIKALRGVNVDWSKVTLYSARLLKDNSPACAAPCSNCQTLIDYLEIGRVIST